MAVFSASQFVAAHSDTAEDKARFANALLAFVVQGCPRERFTKAVYNKLIHCFGHIAHFDRDGFYAVWFSSPAKIAEFLDNVVKYPHWGDPQFTYSDVERAFKIEVLRLRLHKQWAETARAAQESAERAILAHLKQKYEPEPSVSAPAA
jgi:hypothetical protein